MGTEGHCGAMRLTLDDGSGCRRACHTGAVNLQWKQFTICELQQEKAVFKNSVSSNI